jgi:hypothetical protein
MFNCDNDMNGTVDVCEVFDCVVISENMVRADNCPESE